MPYACCMYVIHGWGLAVERYVITKVCNYMIVMWSALNIQYSVTYDEETRYCACRR